MPLVPVVLPGAKAKSFWSRLRGTGWKSRYLRASPAVWQIELPSLIFGKNVKKYSSNSLAKDLAIFGNLGKTSLQRGWHRGF